MMGIFDIHLSLEYSAEKFSLSASFNEGDKDCYGMRSYKMALQGDRVDIRSEVVECSDTYHGHSRFSRKDLPEFLERLRKEGLERIFEIYSSLESYTVISGEDTED